jgi:hypothetical protein
MVIGNTLEACILSILYEDSIAAGGGQLLEERKISICLPSNEGGIFVSPAKLNRDRIQCQTYRHLKR